MATALLVSARERWRRQRSIQKKKLFRTFETCSHSISFYEFLFDLRARTSAAQLSKLSRPSTRPVSLSSCRLARRETREERMRRKRLQQEARRRTSRRAAGLARGPREWGTISSSSPAPSAASAPAFPASPPLLLLLLLPFLPAPALSRSAPVARPAAGGGSRWRIGERALAIASTSIASDSENSMHEAFETFVAVDNV